MKAPIINFTLNGHTSEQYIVRSSGEYYKFFCINSTDKISYILILLNEHLSVRFSDRTILAGTTIDDRFVKDYFKDEDTELIEIENFSIGISYTIKECGWICSPGMDFTHIHMGKHRPVKLMAHNGKLMKFYFMDTGYECINNTYPIDRKFTKSELNKFNLVVGITPEAQRKID